MEGEGLFNWRMVFPFKYIPEEKVMIVEKKVYLYCLILKFKKFKNDKMLKFFIDVLLFDSNECRISSKRRPRRLFNFEA